MQVTCFPCKGNQQRRTIFLSVFMVKQKPTKELKTNSFFQNPIKKTRKQSSKNLRKIDTWQAVWQTHGELCGGHATSKVAN